MAVAVGNLLVILTWTCYFENIRLFGSNKVIATGKSHTRFVQSVLASSKLDSNPCSTIPTIIFLFCTFALLHLQFYRSISPSTRWRTRLAKDILFHWIFYYTMRIWFLFLKFGRYIITSLDYYIEMTSVKEDIFVNKMLNHGIVFMFVLTVSMVPLLILSVQQLYRWNNPQFLPWEPEDPWVPSELGTSEQYLDRPARFVSPFYRNKNIAYRSGRSASVDPDIFVKAQSATYRPYKSLTALGVVESRNLEYRHLEPNYLESGDLESNYSEPSDFEFSDLEATDDLTE